MSHAVKSDWRRALPVIGAHGVMLRELRLSDAPSLDAHLATRDVSRFISPPPTTVYGFERFIAWTHTEREAGRFASFAVIPAGTNEAVGLFQLRRILPSFELAEWGFAIGESFWGTGLFAAAALRVVDFAVTAVGVQRLEARSSLLNNRGNGALRKLGAAREAVLRKSFLKDGVYHDQVLWAITADEWRCARPPASPGVH